MNCQSIVGMGMAWILVLLFPTSGWSQFYYTATYQAQPASVVGGTNSPVTVTLNLSPPADGTVVVTGVAVQSWTNQYSPGGLYLSPIDESSVSSSPSGLWPAGTTVGQYVFYSRVVSQPTTVTFAPYYRHPDAAFSAPIDFGSTYTLQLTPQQLIANVSLVGTTTVHVDVSLSPGAKDSTTFNLISSNTSVVSGGSYTIPPNGTASLDLPINVQAAGSNTVTLTASIQTPTGLLQSSGNVDIPRSITITQADLVSNKVTVQLVAPDSGTLTVMANGNATTYAAIVPSGSLASGTYQVSFDRPNMPIDTYTSVTATWNVSPPLTITLILQNQWRVLGLIRHTQYNTPAESQCKGGSGQAWVFTSSCQFTQTTLDKDFMKQTVQNGTGLSQSFGLLKFIDPSKSGCAGSYPIGATSGNTFLQVSSVIGACNLVLSGNISVATSPSPNVKQGFACKDAILLTAKSNTNEAVKEVDDYCPVCGDKKTFKGADGHIDNYSPSNACSLVDLGKFWTADTHGEKQ